jgi:uncharacterized protein YuzE
MVRPILQMKRCIQQNQNDEIHPVFPSDALTPGSSDDPNGVDSASRWTPSQGSDSEGRPDSPLGAHPGDGGKIFASHPAPRWRDGSQRLLWPEIRPVKIQYFEDTDTLYIEFRAVEVAETKDLDENTLLDLDPDGNICGITVEHARERADLPKFSYEQITA